MLIAFRSYAIYRDPLKVEDILAALVGEKLASVMLSSCTQAFEIYFKYRLCPLPVTSSLCSQEINPEEDNLLKIFHNALKGNRLQVRELSKNVLTSNGVNGFPIAMETMLNVFQISASIEPRLEQLGAPPLLDGITEGYDLTNTEALILFGIRSWVCAMSRNQNPAISVVNLFESHKISKEPATAFDQFMHIVNNSIVRPMIVQCPCSVIISPDEARLLGTLAACQFHLDFQLYRYTASFADRDTVRSIRTCANTFLSLLSVTERWLPLRMWDMNALVRANRTEGEMSASVTRTPPQWAH